MKNKNLLLIITGLAISTFLYGQYIPNGGFENWEDRELWEEPENWNTGNMEAFMFGPPNVSSTTNSHSGTYAMRLETTVSDGDIYFAYVFSNGEVTGGELRDTIQWEGGFPVTGTPDSIAGYFRYSIAPNDSAFIFVAFKKAGTVIGQNLFALTGSQNTYAKMVFEILPMDETPDTAFIAFTSSNPENPLTGGWLQVDSIWFTGSEDIIPNSDFEVWNTKTYHDPVSWLTSNLFIALFGGEASATPSTDAYSGEYALRIESVRTLVPTGEGFDEGVTGFGIPFIDMIDFNDDLPVIPLDFNPSALSGYYKFDPAGIIPAYAYIVLIDNHGIRYEDGGVLMPVNNYTRFEFTLDYPSSVTITGISVVFTTTAEGIFSSENPGSVLFIDDVDLLSPCDVYEYSITFEKPLCGDNTIVLEAGQGWDSYQWSNGSTADHITVPFDFGNSYSVTVTDNQTGCVFTDNILLEEALCTSTELTEARPAVAFYPNPASDILTVEISNPHSGTSVIEIFNITGKKILGKEISGNQDQLDISDFPKGLYLLKVYGSNLNFCQRFAVR